METNIRGIMTEQHPKYIPSYPKVLTLGAPYTERTLIGDVIIQEKVDGSLFLAGVDINGNLVFRSKGQIINREAVPNIFLPSVENLLAREEVILASFKPSTFFYMEALHRPRHNAIAYARVPTGNAVLFDAVEDGSWQGRERLVEIAEILGIDLIPELYRGAADIDFIKGLLDTDSYLGNSKVEGVVIKNYHEVLELYGAIRPIFAKLVSDAFKEKMHKEWDGAREKDSLQEFLGSFRTEARWQKAVMHLEEQSLLEHSPRDIGAIIREVNRDIEEEEAEEIKRFLYNHYRKQILRTATSRLPEWWKDKLVEDLKEKIEGEQNGNNS